ncbi:MAG: hypothetical protein ACE5GB_04705 [Acidimicrobiales bacterium]
MTDSTSSDDELVSAYLDGEASPDEIEQVRTDATLARRARELAAIRDAVAAPVQAPSADARDRAIEAALAMSSATDMVTGIGAARARRAVRWQPIAAAAAAVLALAIAVPLLVQLGGDGSETAGVSADIADEAAADAGDDSAAETFSRDDAGDVAAADAGGSRDEASGGDDFSMPDAVEVEQESDDADIGDSASAEESVAVAGDEGTAATIAPTAPPGRLVAAELGSFTDFEAVLAAWLGGELDGDASATTTSPGSLVCVDQASLLAAGDPFGLGSANVSGIDGVVLVIERLGVDIFFLDATTCSFEVIAEGVVR